jgi:hypothetical protein
MTANHYAQNSSFENNQGLHYSHFSPICCATRFTKQIVTNEDVAPKPENEGESAKSGYQAWLKERDADKTFTSEQRAWLDRMAEHIATSLAIEPEDFETGWFGQHGSLGKAHALFGDTLRPLMAEQRLVA